MNTQTANANANAAADVAALHVAANALKSVEALVAQYGDDEDVTNLWLAINSLRGAASMARR